MRKKDKLYTANKWNKPLFAQGIDREYQNIFDGFFSSTLNTPTSLSTPGLLSGNSSGLNTQAPQLSKPTIAQPVDWSDGLQSKLAVQDSQNLVDGFSAEAAKNNPLSGLGKVKPNIGGLLKSNAGAIGGAVGSIGNKLISGGLESGAGSAISNIGGTIGSAISTVNPVVGGIVSAASGVIGGLTNRAFGSKLNKEKIAEVESSNKAVNTVMVDNSSTDSVENQWANQDFGADFSKSDIGKDGWFSNKAKKKYRKLKLQQDIARNRALTSFEDAASAADTQSDLNAMANYAAFGGPLSITDNNDNMGAIDYDFMSDYLISKNKSAEAKNKIPINIFGNLANTSLFALGGGIHIKKSHRGLFTKEAKEHDMGVQEFASHVLANKDKYSPEVVKRANFARNSTKFALGGDMQTNGSDFSDGLQVISAGGSHENNPYDGVQLGIDAQGKPNLVEEGETIFDDYVFSKRIKADAQTKKKFHVGKNADISYADLSKKLEKESAERPNDAISLAGLEKQMHDLADEQERQKSEMQAKEVQEVFASLPPEQQRAIMQQVVMEEQHAQQQQMEQPTEEVPQQVEQQSVNEQMMQQPV